MILLIDNYDSFVHNLARYLAELGQPTLVRRNREITVAGIRRLDPRALVISPGPCDPERAGVSVPAVRELSGKVPILGICLGHQAIAAALGGRVARASEPVHGIASPVHHDGQGIFAGLPSPFTAARYHSLAVPEESLPPELLVSATTRDRWGRRVVMAVRHREALTIGLQFHPESVLTEHGHRLLGNFLSLCAAFHGEPLRPRPEEDREEGRSTAAGPEGISGPLPAPLEFEAGARAASEGGAARAGLFRGEDFRAGDTLGGNFGAGGAARGASGAGSSRS